MAKNMLIHDTRLAGGTPRTLAQNNYRVNGGTLTKHIFDWAAQYARSQSGLDNLFIMCHGNMIGVHDTDQSLSTLGGGLQLGKDNLTLANVAFAEKLNGLVGQVTIFACGPARTRPGFDGTAADGRRFCGYFAVHSSAPVIAAVDLQYYRYRRGISLLGVNLVSDGEIDFGPWEGPVYRFSPENGEGSRVL